MALFFSPALEARDCESPGCEANVRNDVAAGYVLDVKPVDEADDHTQHGSLSDVSSENRQGSLHHGTDQGDAHEERDYDVEHCFPF